MHSIVLAFALHSIPVDPVDAVVGPVAGVPTQPVAIVTCDDARRVLDMLAQRGIAATADGPFVYYEVRVASRNAKLANSALKADAAKRGYWLQTSGER